LYNRGNLMSKLKECVMACGCSNHEFIDSIEDLAKICQYIKRNENDNPELLSLANDLFLISRRNETVDEWEQYKKKHNL